MIFRSLFIVIAAVLIAASCDSNRSTATSTLIVNATIHDGSGADGYSGSLRFDGDRITAIGDLEPVEGETVIDAEGLILAPGFIDPHGHYYDVKSEFRHMPAVLSQGISTVVTGMDGFSAADENITFVSHADLVEAFTASPAAVNIASYTPHNSIRQEVMGDDYRRSATAVELAAMARLVEADMLAGTIGLSTGLEYEPGIYSSTEEVILLSRVAAHYGGHYASHMRDEDDRVMESIAELIRIGREASIPVHISHIKLADRALWGTSDKVIALLDAARADGVDVTADIYPYERWASNLGILFPDRDFSDRKAAEFTFKHTAAAEDILLSRYTPNPEFEGLTIADVAKLTERDAESTLMDLAQTADEHFRETGQWAAMIIAKGMREEDIAPFMQWPYTSICSDGGYYIDHPRSYGAFPRVLRRFVNELETLTMSEAIYKMTGLSAQSLGIDDRGTLKSGMHADLVLFDPATIADKATMKDPDAASVGVQKVWVNGVLAFDDGEPTRLHAGRIVTHST